MRRFYPSCAAEPIPRPHGYFEQFAAALECSASGWRVVRGRDNFLDTFQICLAVSFAWLYQRDNPVVLLCRTCGAGLVSLNSQRFRAGLPLFRACGARCNTALLSFRVLCREAVL